MDLAISYETELYIVPICLAALVNSSFLCEERERKPVNMFAVWTCIKLAENRKEEWPFKIENKSTFLSKRLSLERLAASAVYSSHNRNMWVQMWSTDEMILRG